MKLFCNNNLILYIPVYIKYIYTCALSSSTFPASPRLPTPVFACGRWAGALVTKYKIWYIIFKYLIFY